MDWQMPKKGSENEAVVADICQSFDQTADVAHGKWVSGPDGRRDRDVHFTGVSGNKQFKVLIECKDYNPATTGKVGIGVIDALDSKRKDLGVDLAMVCSNAGFTKPAMAKARRVGICIIGALRADDRRLLFKVSDSMFSRKVTVPTESCHIRFEPVPGSQVPGNIECQTLSFDGLSMQDWFLHRIRLTVAANPIVNGFVVLDHALSRELSLQAPWGQLVVNHIFFEFSITGAWYKHHATIDASSGYYDWLRKRVRTAPGHAQVQIAMPDIHAGSRVSVPPRHVLCPEKLLPGEWHSYFLKLHAPLPNGLSPNLDDYLSPEDRQICMPSVDAAAYTSTPGFVPIP
jgi:hypothetical protein